MFNSGFRNRRPGDGQGVINTQTQYLQKTTPIVTISGWSIQGSDDTALNPAGGQTVLVNGTGFATGCSATLGGTQIGAVTFLTSTQISFVAPANSGGSYTLIVYNTNGYAAILTPGLTYSTVPTWVTNAGSIGTYYETTPINSNVVATSDSALTYSLASGALPSGATLYANGVITGTAPVDSGSTTYTFNITATDAELQDTTRTFTMTINVDVVTWVTPSNGATISVGSGAFSQTLSATDAAGYAVTYSANTLPAGLSLSGNTVSGTATTSGSTSTLLTATAATTGRTGTNTVTWVVQLGDTYFQYVTAQMSANASIVTNSFVNDASLNNFQLTVVADARASIRNPLQQGYYSGYFDGTGDYLSIAVGSPTIGNFTWETWVYDTGATTYGTLLGWRSAGANWSGFIVSRNNGAANVSVSVATLPSASLTLTQTSGTYTTNKWQHVALTRLGSTVTLYVNGIAEASGTFSNAMTPGAAYWIGSDPYNNVAVVQLGGYISNQRFVNGVCLYTANFTPSTTPLTPVAGTYVLTCQSNRFIDNSLNNYVITKNGDTTVTPNHPFATINDYGTANYSVYFDGTYDYVNTTTTYPMFGFGTGDFTIEAWIWINGTGTTNGYILFDMRNGSSTQVRPQIYVSSSMVLYYYTYNANRITGPTLSPYTWYHIALTRASGSTKMWVNGSQVGSTYADTTDYTSSNRILIGNTADTPSTYNANWLGYISNFRVVTGAAVYTGTFVPPTSTLAITQSAGTNIAAITQPSYGVYFNGSTDYLSVPYSALFALESSDFTIECWVYRSVAGAEHNIAVTRSAAVSDGWNFRLNSTNTLQLYYTGGSSVTSTGTVSASQWYHVAATRSGTTVRLFINGTLDGSATFSNGTANSQALRIGVDNTNAAGYMNGYISNFRITKGQALYTATFTPATSPLTTTSQGATAANVSLLTCQSTTIIDNSLNLFAITKAGTPFVVSPNPFATSSVTLLTMQSATIIDNSANSLTLTNNGNTVPLLNSPFATTNYSSTSTTIPTLGSAYFDGTGDSILLASTPATTFGTGDFTIECWFYTNSIAANQMIYDARPSAEGAYPTIYINTSGQVLYYQSSATRITSSAVVINTWYHLAVVRASSSTKMYLNGVLTGSAYSDSTSYLQSAVRIGSDYTPGTVFNGYLSNMRVVKGTAVYTANFYPSLTPLTAVTNTSLLALQYNGAHNASTPADTSPLNSLTIRGGNATQGAVSPYGNTWSNYFDGNGDYLTVAASSALTLTSGDFTIECWFYCTSLTAQAQHVFNKDGVNSVSYPQYALTISSAGVASFGLGNGNGLSPTSTDYTLGTIAVGTWYHAACVRTGTTIKTFLNGTQVTSTAQVTAMVEGNKSLYIGFFASGVTASYFNGYLSNLRITKGTALYTASFTAPTAPLPSLSSTSLLTCNTNRLIDTSANNFTITKNGDTKVQSFSPFAAVTVPTYYSGAFDGTGDYLTVPSNPVFAFSTGDFTIEAWIYLTAYNGTFGSQIFGGHNYGVGADMIFVVNTTGKLYLQISASATGAITSTSSVSLNTWTHVAVVRSSGTVTPYINGVNAGGSASYTTSVASTINPGIGSSSNGNNSAALAGYISNLRVVKGLAVYTANFVPPTAPLATTQSAGTNIAAITQTSYSNYFDGTGDYLSIADSPAFTLGSNNFTLEMWIYPTTTGTYRRLYNQYPDQNNQIFFRMSNTEKITFSVVSASSTLLTFTSTTSITANTWTHVAVVRNSSTFTFYINGTADATTGSYAGSIPDFAAPVLISSYDGTNEHFTGYISNLRLTNGIRVYTGNFTAPTAPLAITQSAGTNIAAIAQTSYSVYFNGSTDYLTVPANTAFQFDTGDFTVEAWINSSTFGANGFLLLDSRAAATATAYTIGINSSGYPYVYDGSTAPAGSSGITAGTWAHVAWCRSGGTLKMFVNGTSVYSASFTSSLTGVGTSLTIGSAVGGAAGYFLTGYISNLRIVKGQALYTANFTPATSPLTTTSQSATAINVSLLTCQSTTIVDNSLWARPITVVGSTRVASANPFDTGTVSLLTAQSTTFIDNSGNQMGVLRYGNTSVSPAMPFGGTTQLLTCQSNTFADNSLNYAAITVAGDTKPVITSPFTPTASSAASYTPAVFGGSYYFDGTGDYVSMPVNTPATVFAASDFTVEAWVYPTATYTASFIALSQGDLASAAGSSWGFYIGSTASAVYVSSTSYTLTSPSPVINQWSHVAFVRSGTSLKTYLNGVQVGSTSLPSATTSINTGSTTYAPAIGGATQGTAPYAGYMSGFRITRAALYTSTFYPPLAPPVTNTTIGSTTYTSTLLLNGTASGVIDDSRNQDFETLADARQVQFSPYSGSYYSNYFVGGDPGDYLTFTNAALDFGSSDFTAECWIYPISANATEASFMGVGQQTGSASWVIRWGAASMNFVTWSSGTTVDVNLTTSSGVTLNTWNHVAVTRSGSTFTVWINGVSTGTATSSTAIGNTGRAAFLNYGFASAAARTSTIYLSNVRWVKGTALYTTNFIPPTSPLTAVANTVLLTCQSNTFKDNSTNAITITTSGTPKVQTQNPFQTNTGLSYYFDGTGDYMNSAVGNQAADVSTGDFTIECWVWLGSVTGTQIVAVRSAYNTSTAADYQWSIYANGTSMVVRPYQSTTDFTITAGTVAIGRWYYVTMVRSGNTVMGFLNGVKAGTTQTVSGALNNSTTWFGMLVGNNQLSSANNYLNGYVADLRITKGYARYTATFTPPTTPQLTF